MRYRATVAALVVACAGSAGAETIDLIYPGFITFPDMSLGQATATASGEIPSSILFDPALGTLEAVEVLFNGVAAVGKTLDVPPGTYGGVGLIRVEISHPASGFVASSTVPLATHSVMVTGSEPLMFAEGNARIFPLSSTENLGVFITGGTLEARVTGLVSIFGPLPEPMYSGEADSLSLGGSVIGLPGIRYTFAPVPEPREPSSSRWDSRSRCAARGARERGRPYARRRDAPSRTAAPAVERVLTDLLLCAKLPALKRALPMREDIS
jgi:hypothetical protein